MPSRSEGIPPSKDPYPFELSQPRIKV